MKITIKYYNKREDGEEIFSHQYEEEWDVVKHYCPSCGVHYVYRASSGDYYEGEQHICTTCGCTFWMPRIQNIFDLAKRGVHDPDFQRLNKLKEEVEELQCTCQNEYVYDPFCPVHGTQDLPE